MKKTKFIFLFLLLALPVLIYLFLQGFGENKFAIPVYYTEGLTKAKKGCEQSGTNEPYLVNLNAINEILQDDITGLITVYEVGNATSDQLKNNLYTFLNKYEGFDSIRLLSINRTVDSIDFRSRYAAWKRYNLPDSDLLRFGRCILQMDLDDNYLADSGLVLIDRNQQIRGYYDPAVLKEIDRLNTELYILLSED